MSGIRRDKVFAALTRPQMFASVTYSYFIVNGVVATELFLIFHSAWVLLAAVVIHLGGVIASIREPRIFDLWLAHLVAVEMAGGCRSATRHPRPGRRGSALRDRGAVRLGAGRAPAVTLLLCERLLGTPLSSALGRTIRRDRAVAALADNALSCLRRGGGEIEIGTYSVAGLRILASHFFLGAPGPMSERRFG